MVDRPDFARDFPINNQRQTIIVRKYNFDFNAADGELALELAGTSIYRRDLKLVRPVVHKVDASNGRATTTVALVPVTVPILRQLLNEAADWMKHDGRSNKVVPVAPPKEVAELILDRVGYWRFPSITGVIATPTMRPDGSLLTTEGYDAATGLCLYSPPPMPDIPDFPTRDDAVAALATLDRLLDGFPFVDQVSRSTALSGLITPVVRGAMSVSPMHVSSAPRAGTGKSYLWDVSSSIAIGRPCAVIAAGRDEAETEKRLVTALLRGQPMVSIDNVNGPLEGDFLCQMIERPVLDLRVLGKSEGPTIDNRICSYATGNNIRGRGDVVRRLLVARLDANMEHPERREFNSKPDQIVIKDRGRYIAACLTIARANLLLGKSDRLTPLPSFEGWSDVVRSALVWLGRADPARSIERGDDDDDRLADAAALFAAWPRGPAALTSYTTAELIEEATKRDEQGELWPGLLDALGPVARNRRGNIEADTLGRWFRDNKDRVIGGLKLTRQGSRHRPTWAVKPI